MSYAGGLYLNMTLPTIDLIWQLTMLSLSMKSMLAESWASLALGLTWLSLREQPRPIAHTFSGYWRKTLRICPFVMNF